MGQTMKVLVLLGLVVLMGGAVKVAQDTRGSVTIGALPTLAKEAEQTCTPGDQDQYVNRPERLQLLRPCLRVTGTVDYLHIENDGDVHIRARLDPPYQSLLVDGNNKVEGGDLVVEPVCYALPLQADVMRLCASDPDRISSIPQLGDHIWMEGRYVLDIGHTSFAELHPLYRWGKASN